MAEHDSLNSLFTDIADAIREKTGSTDPIIANYFPEEILKIAGGSSASDGGIQYTNYYNYSKDAHGYDFFYDTDAPNVGAKIVIPAATGSYILYPIEIKFNDLDIKYLKIYRYNATSMRMQCVKSDMVTVVGTEAVLSTSPKTGFPYYIHNIIPLNENNFIIIGSCPQSATTMSRVGFLAIQIYGSSGTIKVPSGSSAAVPQASGTINLGTSNTGTGRKFYGYISQRSLINNSILILMCEEQKNNATGAKGLHTMWLYSLRIENGTDSNGNTVLVDGHAGVRSEQLTAAQTQRGSYFVLAPPSCISDIYTYYTVSVSTSNVTTTTRTDMHLGNFRYTTGTVLSTATVDNADSSILKTNSHSYGITNLKRHITFDGSYFTTIYRHYQDIGGTRVPSTTITTIPNDGQLANPKYPVASWENIHNAIIKKVGNTHISYDITPGEDNWYVYLGNNMALIAYDYNNGNLNEPIYALIKFIELQEGVLRFILLQTKIYGYYGIYFNSNDNIYHNYTDFGSDGVYDSSRCFDYANMTATQALEF